MFAGYIPIGDDKCRFDFNKLEEELKKLIRARLGNENFPMHSRQPLESILQCHTFVVAKMAQNVGATPTLFRSYSLRGERDTKCSIWQAARATTAAPTIFKPMSIETRPRVPILYVDGGMGHNNPAQLALREAGCIWEGTAQYCLLSIGTGQSSAQSLPCDDSTLEGDVEVQHSLFNEIGRFLSKSASKIPYWETASNIPAGALNLIKIANTLKSIATDTETVHRGIFEEAYQKYPYFRFNVERDIGDIGLQELKKFDLLTTHTYAYMNSPERKKDMIACSECLINPVEFCSTCLW